MCWKTSRQCSPLKEECGAHHSKREVWRRRSPTRELSTPALDHLRQQTGISLPEASITWVLSIIFTYGHTHTQHHVVITTTIIMFISIIATAALTLIPAPFNIVINARGIAAIHLWAFARILIRVGTR